jgi:hypothetical protein
MYILRALLPIFIALPGCIKKKEASQSEVLVVREALDLPNDEELEEDASLPECGEKDE